MGLLGLRIREKRRDKNLTLKGLADLTRVTNGYLSQVENGLVEPSISTLRQIAKALEVPIFYFLMEETEQEIFVRKDQRRTLHFPESKLNYELLSPNLDRKIEMLIGTIEPGGMSCPVPLPHEGEDCLLVLKGVMKIIVGDRSYELQEGDSIYIAEMAPHQIINESDESLVFVSATTPAKF